MTKRLERLRLELAKEYHGCSRGNWGPDFLAGFDAATKELMRVIEIQKHGLNELDSGALGNVGSTGIKSLDLVERKVNSIVRETLRLADAILNEEKE